MFLCASPRLTALSLLVVQVNMMPAQPYHPQNPVPFGQPGAQFGAPESHFGQVDVNDLLSKLISTGIIAGSAPVQPEDSKAAGKGQRMSVCVWGKVDRWFFVACC